MELKKPNPLRTVDPKDRKLHSSKKRNRMLRESGNKCYYCQSHIETTFDMHIDHKTPLSRGGSDTPDNLVVACIRCDNIKNDLTESEFRARGLGKTRNRPFNVGRGMPKTLGFLKAHRDRLPESSRTRDILSRVINGERVNISEYDEYVNERRDRDTLITRIKKYARDYPFLAFEGGVLWKK